MDTDRLRRRLDDYVIEEARGRREAEERGDSDLKIWHAARLDLLMTIALEIDTSEELGE